MPTPYSVCQICNSKLVEKEDYKNRYHCFNNPLHYEASFGGFSFDKYPITSYIARYSIYIISWTRKFKDLYITNQKDNNKFKAFPEWDISVFLKSDEEIENYLILA